MNGLKHHLQHAGSLKGFEYGTCMPQVASLARGSRPGAAVLPAPGQASEAALPSHDSARHSSATPGGAFGETGLQDLHRRFWATLPLTLLVVAMALVDQRLVGRGAEWLAGLQLLLCLPVLLWAARPVFLGGLQSIRGHHPDKWALISVATAVAATLGLVAIVSSPDAAASAAFHAHAGVYLATASLIVSLSLLGRMVEERAWRQGGAAFGALLGLAPSTAWRLRSDGSEEQVPTVQLQVGDRVRVYPGERVPADGQVLRGAGMLDECLLTGDAILVPKQPSDGLLAGALFDGHAALTMQVQAIGSQTVLGSMVVAARRVQCSSPLLQGPVDALVRCTVPVGAAVAVCGFLLWGQFGAEPRWIHASLNALAVLVAAGPWALELATPLPVMVAIGRAASLGILFRDGRAIEDLRNIDTLLIDKTGVLTEGRPVFDRAVVAPGWDETRLLQAAASLEQASGHPLAQAIVNEAKRRGLVLLEPEAFESLDGIGVRGVVAGQDVAVGNASLMDEEQVYWEVLGCDAEWLRQEGACVVYVAVDNKPAGLIAMTDPVRPGSAAALKQLARAGVRVVMVTGDGRTTARWVAAQVGIEELLAEVRPAHKPMLVKHLQVDGCKVGLAGDVVKDATALAQADAGIALEVRPGVAWGETELTLVKGDLCAVARAVALSHRAVSTMQGNLFFAGACQVVGLPLAAGLLYPLTGWLMSPLVIALAASLSLVSVVLSSLRLRISSL